MRHTRVKTCHTEYYDISEFFLFVWQIHVKREIYSAKKCRLPCSAAFLNTGTINETLQQFRKQDFVRHELNVSASMMKVQAQSSLESLLE